MLSRVSIAAAALYALCFASASAAIPPPAPPPVATFDVGSLHVEEYGSGSKTLIFIPGLTCGPWEWSGQIAHFAPGYTIYALTLPGFDGRPPISGSLFATTTADFWRLLHEKHIVKPIVIGHSLGGTMGFMLATQHPERLGGVVALDGLPILPGMNFVPRAQVEQIASRTEEQIASTTQAQFAAYERTTAIPPLVTAHGDADAIAALAGKSDPGATARWLDEDMLLDLRPELPKATVAILLIAPFDASVDAQYTLTTAEAKRTYYASLVSGAPNLQIVMIDRSRHFAMYDRPHAVTDAIAHFLSNVNVPHQAAAGGQTPSPAPAPSLPPLPANCTAVRQPFSGTICAPSSGGTHPAVILLGGSEGGDLMGRTLAPLVAEHGYLAVSVAYFKEPGLPQTLVDIPVETVGRALHAILARRDVDPDDIAILGGSKGGELALLAASTYPQITAVVADVPSPVAWPGLGPYGQPDHCSWTLGGKELPCVPESEGGAAAREIQSEYAAHEPMTIRALYDQSLQTASAAVVNAAYFPLEHIHGPVLCLSAADDQLWDSPAYCRMTLAYLRAHHHPYADRAIDYPNAGHTFLWAIHGARSVVLSVPVPGGASIALGGTVAGDLQASALAWPVIWQFLATALQ